MAANDAGGWAAERWIYAGVRVNLAGAKMTAWIDAPAPDGRKPLHYKPVRGAGHLAIGGIYPVETRRDGDRVTRRFPGAAPELDGRWDGPEAAEWAAADKVARIALARAALERSAARLNPLDQALAPVLRACAQFATPDSQDAAIAYISGRIRRAWATQRHQREN